MLIEAQSAPALEFATSCLVLPVWQDEELAGSAAALNEKLGGLAAAVIAEDGFKAASGDTRVLYTQGAAAASRTLLLGLGKKSKFTPQKLRQAIAKGARAVRALKRADFALELPALPGLDATQAALAATEAIAIGLYTFSDFKTDEDTLGRTQIERATLLTEAAGAATEGIRHGQITAEANLRARTLVNRPSNLKWPDYLANEARKIAHEVGLGCEVWDEERIQVERMGALYGVGMGSDKPPRFIVLDYSPAGATGAPIVLVGKGMTFDTGGYSLKPSTSMEDMKDDMAGAALVLAAMWALPALKIGRRVLGIVPTAENMINGHAQRPGDIVTARNGKTIEVLNTDAEGRLILADALSYASEQKPAAIIDFATLTGAIGVALGQEAAGLFANDDALAARIQSAGERSGERVWPFPMWDEYKEHVKGTISDLKNIGQERRAGSIAGAVFLDNFVPESIPWAHLDIAAVSLIREDRPLSARGATGFGVRLALDLLGNWE